MKVTIGRFLVFQRRVISMYLIIMAFITIMLYVEPTMSIHYKNIIYIHIVTLFTFTLYLGIEFIVIKNHISRLEAHWEEGNFIQEGLGEPRTYEQYLHGQLFQMINDTHQRKMLSILYEKKETLEFMTSWFHEIKTPIAVSKLIIDQASKTTDVQSLDDEIDRIDCYVEQALYFVRTDDFNHDYFISQSVLDQITRSVVKQHAKIFIKKNIKIDFEVASIDVLTDKKWLQYVLSQIISNALFYTKEAGMIRIQSEEDAEEVRLRISDNGIGIPQADLLRVFDKGFTGENGRIYGKSTGMGLYLAEKMTKKLGHKLTVSSKENEGTSFTIHFSKGLDYYSIL